MPLINAGISISQKDNLIEAAKEAAQKVKKELGEKKPKLLMFFCIFTYPKKDYKQALKAIYDVFGDKDIPLVGGSVLGFFAKDKYYFDINLVGRSLGVIMKGVGKIIPSLKFNGVSVVALESDYLSIGTGLGLNTEKEPEKAGKDCITQALDNLDYNPSLAYLAMMKKGAKDITRFRPLNGFLLTPGTTDKFTLPDQKIIDGIVSVTKRTVRLAGGGASRGTGPVPLGGFTFFNGEVYKNAVISILFGSDLEIGYGVAAGVKPLSQKAVITKAKDHIIYELNNRPAAEVIREVFENYTDTKEKDLAKIAYDLNIKGYIFSFPDAKGDFYWPLLLVDFSDDGSVTSMAPIKEGMGISFAMITKESLQKATVDAVKMMMEDVQTKDFGFVFFASCAARGQILSTKYFKEIEIIKRTLGQENLPVFGICSNGEQGFYKAGLMIGACFVITMMGISNRLISEIRE